MIPALLLILVVETSFMSAVLRYRGIWESGIGGLIALRFVQKAKSGKFLPPLKNGLGGLGNAMLAVIAAIIDAFFLRPTKRTNSILAVLTMLLASAGEAVAFAGLAFDPAGTMKTISAVTILVALGVLIFQVFLSLVLSVFSVRAGVSAATANGQPPSADSAASFRLTDNRPDGT